MYIVRHSGWQWNSFFVFFCKKTKTYSIAIYYNYFKPIFRLKANVGGASTTLTSAKSLGREDLALAGILVGALGNATGTYWGFLIAAFLRNTPIF